MGREKMEGLQRSCGYDMGHLELSEPLFDVDREIRREGGREGERESVSECAGGVDGGEWGT